MNDLIIKNINVEYQKGAPVLKDFTLRVKSGELIVILGPSGCGKSTLLTAVSGLKKPVSGSISFGETCLFNKQKHINVAPEQRNIGFVFQSYALWPHMSVYDNIAFALKAKRYKKNVIKGMVNDILDTVHMSEYAHKYPGELSGGEKQRIALARSLVYQPSVLLLDEPLANLDANLKTSIMREIKEIQRKLGITTIYVTHDQSEAFEIADRIVIMNEGEIMQKGSPRQVYRNSKNVFVADFIGKNNIFKKCGSNCPRFLKQCKSKNVVTVRPEDIYIDRNGNDSGLVKEIMYKGDRCELIIESGQAKLLVYAPSDEKYRIGDEISFDIKRYHTI